MLQKDMRLWHFFLIGIFFLPLSIVQGEEDFQEDQNNTQKDIIEEVEENTQKESEEKIPEEQGEEKEIKEKSTPLLATEGELEIHSFLANADSGKQEKEWVKLQNTTEKIINISGFSLSDEKGIFFTIPQNTLLFPQELFHAEGWGSKLNNTGDSLLLLNPEEEIFQEISFDTQKKSEVFFISSPEISTTSTSSSSQNLASLRIIQFLANAEKGKEEFTDIRNFSDFSADLSGYTLWDAKGKIFSFENGFQISAGGSAHISGWGSKLNNGGDSIILKDSSGNILDQISFGTTEKGEICVEGNQFCRDFESGEGIFSGGGNTEIDLVSTPSHWQSPTTDEVIIHISEVLFSGKEDFIELFCEKCDQDLKGIRVGDDDIFFEFPPETIVKSGEYILLHFTKKDHNPLYTNNIWYFPINRKGLTKTDETLFLLDSQGNVFDAICIANGDRKISSTEKKDLRQLINKHALLPPSHLTEKFCANSKGISKITSLVFGGIDRGSPGEDYFWTEKMTPGWKNPKAPLQGNIHIAEAGILSSDTSFVLLENKGKESISLDAFFLEWGEKKKEYEVLEDPPRMISHISFQKKSETALKERDLAPGEKQIFFQEKNKEYFSHVRLRDPWKKIVSKKKLVSKTFDTQTQMIREIYANPKGKDEGKEFLEISCPFERCPLSSIFLINNEKHIPLPDETLSRGETFLLQNISLSNSNLSLEIFDPLHQHKESIFIESVKEEKSFSLLGNEMKWTDVITPNQENIFAIRKEDQDHDGFEDTWEANMGLDPEVNDMNNIFAQRVFQQYWKRKSFLKIEEIEGKVSFSGKSIPNTNFKIQLALSKKKQTGLAEKNFSFATDDKGNFSFQKTPFLFSEEYMVVLKTEEEKEVLTTNFIFTKNPQEGWIQTVKIHGVLPNPKGKDNDREMILIQSSESGILRDAFLVFREKKYLLPDIILKAEKKKILQGSILPSLINQGGELFLKNKEGKVLSHISWGKAETGEWIGEDFPAFVKRKKKGKQRKKNKKKRKPILPMEEKDILHIWEGEILSRSGNILILKNDERNFLFFGTFSPFLQEGDQVKIQARGQKIEDISRLVLPQSLPLGTPKEQISQNILVLLLVSILMLGASISAGRKIQE